MPQTGFVEVTIRAYGSGIKRGIIQKETNLRLSLFTDFSLRLLMYLACASERLVSTREVADAYGISVAHLQKAVLGLARLGYIEAITGRKGGLRLAMSPEKIRLGEVVEKLEDTGNLVDCRREPCPLAGRCILKGVLDNAEQAFIDALNKKTLADVVASPTGKVLLAMTAQQTRLSQRGA